MDGTARRNFPCTGCGLCCQVVGSAPQTRFLDRGDGTCRQYDAAGNACSIYDTRPDVCRVDRHYDLHFADKCSWEAFIELNLGVCSALAEVAISVDRTK